MSATPPGGVSGEAAQRLLAAVDCQLHGYVDPDDGEAPARAAAKALLRELAAAVREWPNGRSYVPGREPIERMRDADADVWLDDLADQISGEASHDRP